MPFCSVDRDFDNRDSPLQQGHFRVTTRPPHSPRLKDQGLSSEQVRTLVEQVGGLLAALQQAGPADRTRVYAQLGVKLTYHPDRQVVAAEATPVGACTRRSVRGGT